MKKSDDAALVSFANIRSKPVVYLFLHEPLETEHLLSLRSALDEQEFQELKKGLTFVYTCVRNIIIFLITIISNK